MKNVRRDQKAQVRIAARDRDREGLPLRDAFGRSEDFVPAADLGCADGGDAIPRAQAHVRGHRAVRKRAEHVGEVGVGDADHADQHHDDERRAEVRGRAGDRDQQPAEPWVRQELVLPRRHRAVFDRTVARHLNETDERDPREAVVGAAVL
jgi:hypothetical protein